MENAYTLAMQIADAISKRQIINSLSDEHLKAAYEELSWKKIAAKDKSEKMPAIKQGHQLIFEEVYKVLQAA